MGGFHQLRVKQRLIYKRFNRIGIKEWCIDVEIIVPGSAAQAMERHHYYRCKLRYDMKLKFGPAISLVKSWQLMMSRE